MEIISSIGLLIVILIAFSLMAGGRASNVLRPATGILNRLIALVVRLVLSVCGAVLKLGGGLLKLQKPGPLPPKDDNRGPGPPPPRWE